MTHQVDQIETCLSDAAGDLLCGEELVSVLAEVADCCSRLRSGPDRDVAMSQLLDITAHNLEEHILPRLVSDDLEVAALAREAAIDLLLARAYLLQFERETEGRAA